MSEYPQPETLELIKNWDVNDPWGLFEKIKEVWVDYGTLDLNGGRIILTTGGWSGNEDIINALSQNTLFWMKYWEKSQRGGLYEFSIPMKKEKKEVKYD